jgi:hypothetical protein
VIKGIRVDPEFECGKLSINKTSPSLTIYPNLYNEEK